MSNAIWVTIGEGSGEQGGPLAPWLEPSPNGRRPCDSVLRGVRSKRFSLSHTILPPLESLGCPRKKKQ